MYSIIVRCLEQIVRCVEHVTTDTKSMLCLTPSVVDNLGRMNACFKKRIW